MTRYRKKSVTVSAEPFKLGMEDGFKDSIQGLGDGIRGVQKVRKPYINTPHGERKVEEGVHMIITNENGEREVIGVKLFQRLYEKVEEA